MRIKQLWAVIPLPSKLKLAYSRVTLNLPTTVFFTLALVQCLFQITLHTWLYTQHQYASQEIQVFALNSTLVTFPLAVRMGDGLLLCKGLPKFVGGPGECIKAQIAPPASKRALSATLQPGASGKSRNVTLVDSVTHVKTVVPQQCMDVLPWVYQSLRATDREDITFALYHLWLFVVSLSAILNESIPHLIAALVLGFFCTIGSAFRIMGTSYFRSDFKRIVVNGSCNGYDFFGDSYFQSRRTEEIVISALNTVVFIASAGLSWHLIKTYGQRSFERVHKRRDMSRLYIVILTMGSCIQVAVFYMVAAIGLFIDQLMLGPLRNLAQYKALALAAHIISLVLVGPWMVLGWTSSRRESKPRTLMFLLTTILFLATNAAMFSSPVYRFLMMTWGFFSMTSTTPIVLMFVILLLALYSWAYLDLGLAEYLKAEEPPHPADKVRWSLAVTSDPEKGISPISKPQVTWVHLPAAIIVKAPATAVRKAARSPSMSSVSSQGSSSSHRDSSNFASSLFTRSRSGSLDPDPRPLPPPGLTPSPTGLPLTSIVTSPTSTSAVVPPSLTSTDFDRSPPPPQVLTRALLEVAASDCVRYPDDSIILRRPSQPRLLNGLPPSSPPSQKNRF